VGDRRLWWRSGPGVPFAAKASASPDLARAETATGMHGLADIDILTASQTVVATGSPLPEPCFDTNRFAIDAVPTAPARFNQRIIPCFFRACARFSIWRDGAADSRKGRFDPIFRGSATPTAAQFGAPALPTVSANRGSVISRMQVSSAWRRPGLRPLFVDPDETLYAIWAVCMVSVGLLANHTANNLRVPGELRGDLLCLIFGLALVPLVVAAGHLTQQPTQATLKLWRSAALAYEFATVTGR